MNLRTRFLIGLGLLLIVSAAIFFTLVAKNQENIPAYSATIFRDCAPWDGAAFTISIRLSWGVVIQASIYRSPNIELPGSFSFPDETGQVGNVILVTPTGSSEGLSGKVSFQQITEENPVEGKFDLLTKTGKPLKGKFMAEWENKIALCG
jgi:hypothetical protein